MFVKITTLTSTNNANNLSNCQTKGLQGTCGSPARALVSNRMQVQMVNGPCRLQVQTWARCHVAMFPSWRASAWDRRPRHQRSTGNSPRPAQCRIKICLTAEKATFSLHQQLLCLFYFRADLQPKPVTTSSYFVQQLYHTQAASQSADVEANDNLHLCRPPNVSKCIQMSSYFRDTAVFKPLRHRVFGCFLYSCGMCRKNHPNHSAALACTTHYTLKAQQGLRIFGSIGQDQCPDTKSQLRTMHAAWGTSNIPYAHCTKPLIWENVCLLICKWT